jgi:hypothetical protein
VNVKRDFSKIFRHKLVKDVDKIVLIVLIYKIVLDVKIFPEYYYKMEFVNVNKALNILNNKMNAESL